MTDNMNEHMNNQQPPKDENGLENTVKKVIMATVGTVAGAVEKAADVITNAASKENIDKLTEKGEKTFQQVKAFGESAVQQVKEFGNETYDKMKQAMDKEEDDDIRHSLSRAADGLRDALDKAGQALSRATSKDSIEKAGSSLLSELNSHKEALTGFIQKMRDVANEEGEMIQQELKEMEEDVPQPDDTTPITLKPLDAEEDTLHDKQQADLNNPDRLGDGEPPISPT